MSDTVRWSAVVARDPTADGKFVYCVKTTNIFCRPNCKARLARRANVEFFDTPAEAQAAGYRSCKRCRPLLASYSPEADKIRKTCEMIEKLPADAPLPGLERLAKEAGLTKHHFHRLFKRETGFTPREYSIAARGEILGESSSACVTPNTPVTPTMNGLDPALVAHDAAVFSFEKLNEEPTKATSEELGMFIIFYTIIATSYGLLLVAFQNEQICKIELGYTDTELLESLEFAFPSLYYLHSPLELASVEQAASFQRQIDLVVEALENPSGKIVDLPIAHSMQDTVEEIV